MDIVKAEKPQGKPFNKKDKQGKGKGPTNGALNKVAEKSKSINRGRTAKKNRYQRLYSVSFGRKYRVGMTCIGISECF